ncbi:MAG: hypothetical protein QFB86_01945 [Patescibacteria group bacterium]|nr:hypothetical protein [Patescibacteria group bacterium]
MSDELFPTQNQYYGTPIQGRPRIYSQEVERENLRRPLTSSTAIERSGQLSIHDELRNLGSAAVSETTIITPQQ